MLLSCWLLHALSKSQRRTPLLECATFWRVVRGESQPLDVVHVDVTDNEGANDCMTQRAPLCIQRIHCLCVSRSWRPVPAAEKNGADISVRENPDAL
eukprot:5944404-Alexandrium_andersonii.AAC.1